MIEIIEKECIIFDYCKCSDEIVYMLDNKKYKTHIEMIDIEDDGCEDDDCDCKYCALSCNGTCRWAPKETEHLTDEQINKLTDLITNLIGNRCCGGCI